MLRIVKNISLIVASSALLFSCYNPEQRAETVEEATDWQGLEYAPQMYHSEAYDPMSQITDKDAGMNYWPFEEVGDGHGEFYNSNHYNPHNMNLREPASETIKRGDALPYRIPKDSLELAAKVKSPFILDQNLVVSDSGDTTYVLSDLGKAQLDDCKQMYLRFCSHCHGQSGEGDGKVGEKFGGVPTYNSPAIKTKPIGHIFHVITHGKGRMASHATQLNQLERWKIATYVQTLQKK